MIRAGFLSPADRASLIGLARDGAAAHRPARRANAVLLLDDGLSCDAAAKVLQAGGATVRSWRKAYGERGAAGLVSFDVGGSARHLSVAREAAPKAYVPANLPRSTRAVGAYIEKEFGAVDDSRSGPIALLHRLSLEYRKPEIIGRKLDARKQQAFIAADQRRLNSLGPDGAVVFADAVHPAPAARPAGCRAPKDVRPAIEPTSGRGRIDIHGAIGLETGQPSAIACRDRSARTIEALTAAAASAIKLLESIEALYPVLALIDVFLDTARYHHAKLVQEWLARPGCRIRLHFVPPYCPHLNPIERLRGRIHAHATHNKCYATCRQCADATLDFST